MGSCYYIQTELVVEYIDKNYALSKTRTNRKLKKCYLRCFPHEVSVAVSVDVSVDVSETQQKKYHEELQKIIDIKTCKKIIHENEQWVKTSYENRYLRLLQFICPRMIRLVKIYKEYTVLKQF